MRKIAHTSLFLLLLAPVGLACTNEETDNGGSSQVISAEPINDASQDLVATSTYTPNDRVFAYADGIDLMATSFCGDTDADSGLEILVLGLEPGNLVQFRVNGVVTAVQASDEWPAQQIWTELDSSYQVEFPIANDQIVLTVEGCPQS